MEEEVEELPKNSLLDLREVENKVGRKTPESLLMCVMMRDAADRDGGCGSDGGGRSSHALNDSFSDKLSNLKQEMRWLRSADASILRQLVAVHEGVEAMRWLMEEEQDAAAGLGSCSLSGSLSSVVEERRPSLSPCRVRPNQTQDLTATNGEDSEDPRPHAARCGPNHKSGFDGPSPGAEARPPRPAPPCTLDPEVTRPTQERHRRASSGLPARSSNAESAKSRPRDSAVAPLRGARPRSDAIRRALIRSTGARGEVLGVDDAVSAQTQQSEGTQNQTLNSAVVEEEGETNGGSFLLVYDAQWCWIESLDDVVPL